MLCKKCGAEIADTSKFCGYCGNSTVEDVPVNNLQDLNSGNDGLNSLNDLGDDLGKTVKIEPVQTNEVVEPINENVKSDVQPVSGTQEVNLTQTPNNSQNTNKGTSKNKKELFFVIGGAALAVIAIVLVVVAYFVAPNNSVDVLEKALANLVEKGSDSATVNANISIGASTGENMTLSSTIKVEKKNDKQYDMSVRVNKSMLFDEMNIYATVDEDDATLYLQSSLVDMLGMTSSEEVIWLNTIMDLEEIENVEDSNEEDVSLADIVDKDHFVYIDEVDGLKNYELIIDQKLIDTISEKMGNEEDESIKEELESMEPIDEPIRLDFYITKDNEISKIELDMSEYFGDEDMLSSLVISIELEDLNDTRVDIPDEARNSTTDIETYMSTNVSLGDDFNADYGEGYVGFDETLNAY